LPKRRHASGTFLLNRQIRHIAPRPLRRCLPSIRKNVLTILPDQGVPSDGVPSDSISLHLAATGKKMVIGVESNGGLFAALTSIVMIAKMLSIDYLKLLGGALILWIAVKLMADERSESYSQRAGGFWQACLLIILADISMGTDNMLAVAAASHGNIHLIAFILLSTVSVLAAGRIIQSAKSRFRFKF
jgi:hypothetical protein